MKRILGIALFAAFLVALPAVAGASGGISNWAAPSSWTPPAAQATGGRTALIASPQPLPFVPIAPCRVADTRGNGFTGSYGPPSMAGGASRNFTISTQCGIPAGAVAVSFNFTVWNTLSYGDLKVYPTAGTVAAVSTLNWNPGMLALANAAVVPLGTSGQITTVNESGSPIDLFIDVNGYYTGSISSSQAFFISSPGPYAVVGSAAGAGVWGQGGNIGVAGTSPTTAGVEGIGSGTAVGVLGNSASNPGVKGTSTNYNGVWAESTNQDGLFATGGRDGAYIQGARHGVLGASTTTGAGGILFGVSGSSASTTSGSAGVFGQDSSGAPVNWNTVETAGVLGASADNAGVLGVTRLGGGVAVMGVRFDSVTPYPVLSRARLANASGSAAYLEGNVSILALSPYATGNLSVAGTLSKGSGSFKIDHPLDPENKYLYHSFVESPDMMNVYNGMIELDADGSAVVKLPAYFQALNREFRYQLTSVGSRQPGIYVDQEVANNEFVISGGKPYGKVSWQVTGIRKDPFAVKYPIVAEVEKEPEAKGHYLHPDAYGKPGEKSATAFVQEAQARKEAEKAQEK